MISGILCCTCLYRQLLEIGLILKPGIPSIILFVLYPHSQNTRNVTYPMSAPPQTREQIAPGILLSSKTLAIILESKMQKFQRFLTGAHKRQWAIKTIWPCKWRRIRFKKKCLAVKKFVKNVHASPFKDLGVIITAQAEVRLKIISHMYPHNWHRETYISGHM